MNSPGSPPQASARSPGFVALVPARMASTRLPDKPLALIGDRPMVVHVAQRAAQAGAERVAVATDDVRIADAVRHWGIEALLTSAAHPSGTDRLAEAASLLGLDDAAIVVNVQGDEPLIPPALIRNVAARLASAPDCVMATAAHPITSTAEANNPNVVKLVLDRAGRALLFSRSTIPFRRNPDVDVDMLRHIGLYAYRCGFLKAYPRLERAPIEQAESLEQLRALWHGHRISVLITDEAPPAGVDTPEDLQHARAAWNSEITGSAPAACA